MSDGAAITKLAIAGGRGRAAAERVATAGEELATALRKAMPFLARRRVPVKLDPPSTILMSDLREDPAIVHTVPFVTRPSGARGVLAFDRSALAFILDGVLGAAEGTTTIDARLSSAQLALASRVTASIVRAVSDALTARLGVAIEADAAAEAPDGAAVAAPIAIEGGGRVLVVLPMFAVCCEEAAPAGQADARIAAAMLDVEIDVVAELGTVRLPLEALAELRVGEILRLPLSVDARARVCAGGATLFQGRPTASGETVAVAIDRGGVERAGGAPARISLVPPPTSPRDSVAPAANGDALVAAGSRHAA